MGSRRLGITNRRNAIEGLGATLDIRVAVVGIIVDSNISGNAAAARTTAASDGNTTDASTTASDPSLASTVTTAASTST